MEINFRRPELKDKDLIERYLRTRKAIICEKTFSNIYLWSRHYNVTFAIVEDTLVFKSENDSSFSFVYPLGEKNISKVIDILMKYSEERNEEFKMHIVTESEFEELEKLYPGKFQIEYVRDNADYVYEVEKLINLTGKKYHGKRNHINRFKENDNWGYEAITKNNLEDCFQMAMEWRKENLCRGEDCDDEEEEEKVAELCVTLNSLRLFEELELQGGLLRVDGKVVAFTIGEPLSEDTFVIHIEKAFANIQGAYPMINQQFLEHAAMNYKYVNREEDVGSEGLRKAKLSYRPIFLVQKGQVTLKKQ